MQHPEICETEDCGNKVVVGTGNPRKWVCIECFNAEMARVRQLADRLRGKRL